MKNLTYIILLALGIFFLSNCGDTFSTVVDVDPPEFESKMTFSAFINNEDSVFGYFVGRNRDIFVTGNFGDYSLDDVDISIKNLSSMEAIYPENFAPAGSFSYNYITVNDSFYKPGDDYLFTLSHPDFPLSETTLSFPLPKDNLENIRYKFADGIDIEGDDNSSITFEIVDDPNSEDYYELEIANVGGFNQFGSFWISTNDPSGTKGYPDDNLIFSDESFNGERKKLTVNFDRFNFNPESGDTLIMKWKTMTRDAYEYSKSVRRSIDTENTPFLSPVQIHSNVNNALGTISFVSIIEYTVL